MSTAQEYETVIAAQAAEIEQLKALLAGPAVRRPLPKKRKNDEWELRIGDKDDGAKLYVTIGLYPDGKPGEVWLDTSKEGSDLRAFITGFAISASMLLQYGVSAERVAHSLSKIAGGPAGRVIGHETIKTARSMIDLVAQLLCEYGDKQ